MEEIKEKIRDMEDKIRRYNICLILVPSEKNRIGEDIQRHNSWQLSRTDKSWIHK